MELLLEECHKGGVPGLDKNQRAFYDTVVTINMASLTAGGFAVSKGWTEIIDQGSGSFLNNSSMHVTVQE